MAKLYLGIAAPVILLTLLWPGTVAAWLFALLGAGVPAAFIALGIRRDGEGWRPMVGVSAALALLLTAGIATLLVLSVLSEEPRIFGLQVSLWVMLVMLWLVPFVLSSWAYSAGFGTAGLRDEDLERLRRLGQQAREDPARQETVEAAGEPWRS